MQQTFDWLSGTGPPPCRVEGTLQPVGWVRVPDPSIRSYAPLPTIVSLPCPQVAPFPLLEQVHAGLQAAAQGTPSIDLTDLVIFKKVFFSNFTSQVLITYFITPVFSFAK